jgi:hypothetical protein
MLSLLTFKKWTLFTYLVDFWSIWLNYFTMAWNIAGWAQFCRKTLHHRGRKRPTHSSSSPKHLLQNVISGIFSSSTHRVYRLEIANFLRTFSHVGILDPALWSVLSPAAPLPFSMVHHYPSPLPCVKKYCICTIVNIQCVRGEGWGLYSAGVLHCVSDQIQNIQNCETTQNKYLGGEGASDG